MSDRKDHSAKNRPLCSQRKLALGENIGDLRGAAIALRTYEISLNGEKSPIIDGLTGHERFFLGMAQVWRSTYRDDVHYLPPEESVRIWRQGNRS